MIELKLYQIRFCTKLVDEVIIIKTWTLNQSNLKEKRFTKTADVARIIRARAPN